MSAPLPQQQVSQMLVGYWTSQAVYVAAKLGLADLLAGGPRDPERLAAATGTDPRSLYRLLRTLASLGVFHEDAEHQFSLTPLAECLRTDVPGSVRPLALMVGEEHYHAWGKLLESVRSGRTAFELTYGMPIFNYLSQHPEQAGIFDASMTAIHGRETQAMLEAYDFSAFGTVVDIGGGNGSTLRGVLQRHPEVRGLLFDLPGVIERARTGPELASLTDRCGFVAGSFFESVPGGADAYLLRHIIHDWDDEKAAVILGHVRRAMTAESRLLVVESVITPGNDPSFAKLLDLNMLVIPGGLERTEDEYRGLFERGGLRLSKVVPTASEVSVLEAVVS